jgi:hypothetical protein
VGVLCPALLPVTGGSGGININLSDGGWKGSLCASYGAAGSGMGEIHGVGRATVAHCCITVRGALRDGTAASANDGQADNSAARHGELNGHGCSAGGAPRRLQGSGQIELGGCDLLLGAHFGAWIDPLEKYGVLLFEEGFALCDEVKLQIRGKKQFGNKSMT